MLQKSRVFFASERHSGAGHDAKRSREALPQEKSPARAGLFDFKLSPRSAAELVGERAAEQVELVIGLHAIGGRAVADTRAVADIHEEIFGARRPAAGERGF